MSDELSLTLFAHVCDRPEAEIDLGEAALLLAELDHPGVDIVQARAVLDDLGEGGLAAIARGEAASTAIRPADRAERRTSALVRWLYDDVGFRGNEDDYYDPRNSFLDEVIASRRGIPITLAILYIDIGRQLGLDLHGIAFPGHFLVRCEMDDGVVIIDPYGGGATLDRDDLQARLRETRNGEVPDDTLDDMLVPASPRDVAARMLRNLKAIHLRAKHYELALPILDWLVEVVPDDAVELRDRGRVFENLECFRAAVGDYTRYLDQVPDADDTDAIRSRVVDLQRAAARLN